jgi:PTH1 family peptidyl-tRNA hydrolase
LHLVAGLGNPGPEYEGTRHNVGFETVEKLARAEGGRLDRRECRAVTGRARIGGIDVLLARPLTYMNASGEAISGLLTKYGFEPSGILVISDDIDLPVGAIRLKPRGSSGGQKGLKSVEQSIGGRDFARLRIGIRGEHYSREKELSDYVLSRFSRSERPIVDETIERAAEAVRVWLTRGILEAMNRFNATPESPGA